MKKPDFILFDVMDTLVFDPAYEVLPALFDRPLKELWSRKNPDAWPAFERGEIDEEAYFDSFFVDGERIDGERLKVGLQEGYRWIEGMPELLGELREAAVEMHILSNYPVWYQDIEAKLGLSEYLPWTFVSTLTGVRKPKPEAYLGAARALGYETEQGLFIDDREGNCEAARALGMRAIRFEGPGPLRRELIELGFSLKS